MGQSKSKPRPTRTVLQSPQRSQSFPSASTNVVSQTNHSNSSTLGRPPPPRSSQLDSRHYDNVDQGTLSFQPVNSGTFASIRTMTQPSFFCTSQQSPGFANGYAFISQQIKPGESFVMKIVQTAPSPPASYPLTSPSMVCNIGRLGLGFTSCDPKFLQYKDLPSRDPNDLLDRPEYWILNGNAAVGCVTGDEFCVTFEIGGRIVISKNGSVGSTVVYVDNSAPLWPFFILFGSLIEISLLGKTWTDTTNFSGDQLRRYVDSHGRPDSSIAVPTTSTSSDRVSPIRRLIRAHHSRTTTTTATAAPTRPPPPVTNSNFVARNPPPPPRPPPHQSISENPIEHRGQSAGHRRGRRGRRNRRHHRDSTGDDNDIEFAAEVVANNNNFYENSVQENNHENRGGRRGRESSSRGNRRGRNGTHNSGVSRHGNFDVASISEFGQEVDEEPGGSRQMREGDWTCPDDDCRNYNFAFRTQCYRCSRDKPVAVENTRGGGNGRGRGRGRGHNRGRGGRGRDRSSRNHGNAPPPPTTQSVAMAPATTRTTPSLLPGSQDGANDDKDSGDCIICCDSPADTVFLPCGHVSLCVPCAQNYWRQQLQEGTRNCPICRGNSSGFIKIYKS